MTNTRKLHADQVRVVSITPYKNKPYDEKSDNMQITFQIGGDIEYPVIVSRKTCSDDQLIRVARYYLHYQMQELADATRGWNMEKAEYDQLLMAETDTQNQQNTKP